MSIERKTVSDAEKIRKESRMIYRNAGLMFGRILLLCCLFPLFFNLRPTSVYLFAAFGCFPWIFSTLLESKGKYTESILLTTGAKKFHFNHPRYATEKYTGFIIPLALIFWQINLIYYPQKYEILTPAPSICLLIYLIGRTCSTVVYKRKLKKFYEELEILD